MLRKKSFSRFLSLRHYKEADAIFSIAATTIASTCKGFRHLKSLCFDIKMFIIDTLFHRCWCIQKPPAQSTRACGMTQSLRPLPDLEWTWMIQTRKDSSPCLLTNIRRRLIWKLEEQCHILTPKCLWGCVHPRAKVWGAVLRVSFFQIELRKFCLGA